MAGQALGEEAGLIQEAVEAASGVQTGAGGQASAGAAALVAGEGVVKALRVSSLPLQVTGAASPIPISARRLRSLAILSLSTQPPRFAIGKVFQAFYGEASQRSCTFSSMERAQIWLSSEK